MGRYIPRGLWFSRSMITVQRRRRGVIGIVIGEGLRNRVLMKPRSDIYLYTCRS